MAEGNGHIRKLIAARDREVEQRRNIADALAQAYERGEMESLHQPPEHDRGHGAGHPAREDVGGRTSKACRSKAETVASGIMSNGQNRNL